MTHDLIIQGGTIIDGTGGEPFKADIAIDQDRISRIGDLSGVQANGVIEARGKLVTPGFVDLHTHLDAQVGWDPEMKSSSFHGVTTALIGNCGVTFAPVSKSNHRLLAELMESVEDIAADAIMDGLPWNWENYGEYLDAVTSFKPALNVVGMVGHSAIRFEAMGDRSMDKGEQPTDSELKDICRMVGESIKQGAAGFSTSRFLEHKVPDGRLTPGTWADLRETEAIQRAIVEAGGAGGLFQVAPDMAERRQIELDMMEKAGELGCQVLFSGGAGPGEQGRARTAAMREYLERNNDAGRRITSITHTRPSGAMFGLAQYIPFRNRAWKALMALPTVEARVEALKDPATRTDLISRSRESGFNFDPGLLHPTGLGSLPEYDLDQKQSLAQIAQAQGKDPIEIYVDRLIASEGKEFWNYWAFGNHLENQWQFMQMEHCIPMLADTGAHVGLFTDSDSPTFLLSELVRERGIFPLTEAVHKITQASADVIGLKDRGSVKQGWVADLNVIDFDNLQTGYPYYTNDFPHNGGRFVVQSSGYIATLVSGQIVVQNGVHTGARPGQVIREFARS